MILFPLLALLYSDYAYALKLPNGLKPIINKKRHSELFASTTDEQSKSGIGWDSHKAIESIPESLVKSIEGNESMRKKFEQLCRKSQV